jgi:pimeloyl-ACP methyl ester carboxylesterase
MRMRPLVQVQPVHNTAFELATPEEHADDLHRLISALDAGPVDLFASSGDAINALALVARHPEQVRTLVAHEPPAAAADREFPGQGPLRGPADPGAAHQRNSRGRRREDQPG